MVPSLGLPNRGITIFSLTTPDLLEKLPARSIDGYITSSVSILLSEMCLVIGELGVVRKLLVYLWEPLQYLSTQGPRGLGQEVFLLFCTFLEGGWVLLGSSRDHTRGRNAHLRMH